VRKATLLERLFGGLHDGADLYPAKAVNPPGVNEQQRRRIDLQDMHRSQEIAAAVALRAAGKKVVLRPTGALIDFIETGKPAVGKLEPDDVIVAVNGKRVRDPRDVFVRMRKTAVGAVVRFTVRRD
jgi:PDZ domain-containing protein